MMLTDPRWTYVVIGLASGLASGVFGIGGGVLIVPALMYFAGFSQHRATGTSLAVLLPPIGLAAAVEYYRRGNVDLEAALIIAAMLFAGGWGGAVLAGRINGPYLRLAFGGFITIIGVSLMVAAWRGIAST